MKAKRTFRRETFSETTLMAFVFNAKTADVCSCGICGENSPMLAPEKIAEFFPVGIREIYRRIEAGYVHFIEIDNRKVLVCLQSLLRANEEN